MHRALQIPEILQQIITQVSPLPEPLLCNGQLTPAYEVWSRNRKAVLNVGLTCKSFSVFALDTIWSVSTSLVPLFKTLDAFQCPTGFTLPVGYRIREEERQRFNAYAMRIRIFVCTVSMTENITFGTIYRILHANQTSCLLPKLRQLVLPLPSEHQDALCLLHPGLSSLTVIPSNHASETNGSLTVPVVVDSILAVGNDLTELAIVHHIDFDMFKSLVQMPALKAVVLNNSSPQPLVMKGGFMQLIRSRLSIRDFTLAGLIQYDATPVPITPEGCAFPAMEHLQTTFQGSMSTFNHYRSSIFCNQFPTLKLFAITYNVIPTVTPTLTLRDMWDNFFKPFRAPGQRALPRLDIICRNTSPINFVFSDLVGLIPNDLVFDYLFLCGGVYDSVHWIQIQEAHMQKPILGMELLSNLAPPPPPFTFGILDAILSRLPHLTHLNIKVDLENIPSPAVIPCRDHRLSILQLAGPCGGAIVAIARCLDRLFPRVQQISFRDTTQTLCNAQRGQSLVSVLEALRDSKRETLSRIFQRSVPG